MVNANTDNPRPKILIVEDDQFMARMETALLKQNGFAPVPALTAREGLDLIDAERFDLVILDLMLPEMDGLEFLRIMRQQVRNTYLPVIVVSARDEVRDRLQALELGADDYITKPFNSQELIARVRAQLRIRKLEEQVIRSEQNYRALVENASEMIIGLDAADRITAFNRMAEIVTGYEFKEVAGRPYCEVMGEDRETMALRRRNAIRMRGETDINLYEAAIRKKSGERRVISWADAAVVDESGENYILILFGQDRTHEFEMRGRIKRLEHLSALGEFAAGIAHEINNPLTGIRSTIQYWASNPDQVGERVGDFDEVIREIDRLTRVTRDLMNFAKPVELNRTDTDVVELLDSACMLYAENMREKGIKVSVEAPGGLPPARLDADKLKAAVANMILNAIQVLESGGAIRVRARVSAAAPGSGLVIEVEDDGPGVPDVLKPKLFNPFYTTRAEGVGLGLSLTHRIVQDHNGRIEVLDGGDGGALFRISIPLIDGEST